MDDRLRRQERLGQLDVLDLLRAGRLDPHRVALAAFLSHERALAAGVPPWAPRSPETRPDSRPLLPLELLLADDGLTARQRVALLLGPVARGVERMTAEASAHSTEAAELSGSANAVLRSTERWVRGELADLPLAETVSARSGQYVEYVRLLYVRAHGHDSLETAPADLEPTLLVPHRVPLIPDTGLGIMRGKHSWDHQAWGLVASFAAGGLLLGGQPRGIPSGLGLVLDACELLGCATPDTAPALLREVADTLLDPDALPPGA